VEQNITTILPIVVVLPNIPVSQPVVDDPSIQSIVQQYASTTVVTFNSADQAAVDSTVTSITESVLNLGESQVVAGLANITAYKAEVLAFAETVQTTFISLHEDYLAGQNGSEIVVKVDVDVAVANPSDGVVLSTVVRDCILKRINEAVQSHNITIQEIGVEIAQIAVNISILQEQLYQAKLNSLTSSGTTNFTDEYLIIRNQWAQNLTIQAIQNKTITAINNTIPILQNLWNYYNQTTVPPIISPKSVADLKSQIVSTFPIIAQNISVELPFIINYYNTCVVSFVGVTDNTFDGFEIHITCQFNDDVAEPDYDDDTETKLVSGLLVLHLQTSPGNVIVTKVSADKKRQSVNNDTYVGTVSQLNSTSDVTQQYPAFANALPPVPNNTIAAAEVALVVSTLKATLESLTLVDLIAHNIALAADLVATEVVEESAELYFDLGSAWLKLRIDTEYAILHDLIEEANNDSNPLDDLKIAVWMLQYKLELINDTMSLYKLINYQILAQYAQAVITRIKLEMNYTECLIGLVADALNSTLLTQKAAYETILVGVLTQEANLNASRLAIAEELEELEEIANETIKDVAAKIAAIQEQQWQDISQIRLQLAQDVNATRAAFRAYLGSILGVNVTGDNFDEIAESSDSSNPTNTINLIIWLDIINYNTITILQIKNNFIRGIIAECILNATQIAVVISPSSKRQTQYAASATLSSASSSSSSSSSSPSGNNTAMYAIIGGVVGGVALLVIIIVVIVVVKKREHNDSV